MDQFVELFKPGKIGSLEIKNRIIMAPMGTMTTDSEGFVTDRTLNYYAERARGGVGLVIVQSTTPIYEGGTPRGMRLYDDRFIPGLATLAHTIHSAGAKAIIQLNHLGKIMSEIRKGLPRPEEIDVIGPSAVPWVENNIAPPGDDRTGY